MPPPAESWRASPFQQWTYKLRSSTSAPRCKTEFGNCRSKAASTFRAVFARTALTPWRGRLRDTSGWRRIRLCLRFARCSTHQIEVVRFAEISRQTTAKQCIVSYILYRGKNASFAVYNRSSRGERCFCSSLLQINSFTTFAW